MSNQAPTATVIQVVDAGRPRQEVVCVIEMDVRGCSQVTLRTRPFKVKVELHSLLKFQL